MDPLALTSHDQWLFMLVSLTVCCDHAWDHIMDQYEYCYKYCAAMVFGMYHKKIRWDKVCLALVGKQLFISL